MGSPQGGLFCAIVQLMTRIALCLLAAALAATPAFAQQQPAAPEKTTEQQARSYIASAFMNGAAPLILSDDVVVQPELRQRLGLPGDAPSRTVYQALTNLTMGKPLMVRPAIRDEVLKSQALPASGKPIFAVEAGDTTIVVQYEMDRENIAFVGQPAAITTAAPVTPPAAPEKVAETPAPPAPAAAAEPPAAPAPEPAESPKPQPAPKVAAVPASKPLQVVEPQVPRLVKPARTEAAAPGPVAARPEPRPLLKPTGACEIKPVMSDQDLVNCGATPR
jgi:hypothetical protein